MTSKFALVIANTEYQDASFAKLTAPGKDAEEFAQILKYPDLAAFDDVQVLLDEGEGKTRRSIARFFSERKRDDLLLLYFSGHGIRNEQGQLFLAANDTEIKILEATGIPAEFITQAMNNSRSQRQLLILDCCNSGAFAHGSKSAPGVGKSMGIATAFEGNGYGRVVLTATDATQFAWEGDKVIGNTQNSVFTHFLIEGLKGNADQNGDGRIDVDEIYDYAYEQVVLRTPKQTPGKWSYRQQGDIILRENLKPRDLKPAQLPSDLLELLSYPNFSARKAGIQELIILLDGKHLGMARAAENKLRDIAENDASLDLRKTAADSLMARGIPVRLLAPSVDVPKESAPVEKPAPIKSRRKVSPNPVGSLNEPVKQQKKIAGKQPAHVEIVKDKSKAKLDEVLSPPKSILQKNVVPKFRLYLIGGSIAIIILGILAAVTINQWSASPPELTPTYTHAPSSTQTSIPPTKTHILTPTFSLFPTSTNAPGPLLGTITSLAPSCYGLSFVSDVTIPDNTPMTAGASFTKTWKVSNSGSCAWDAGFKWVNIGGDRMSGLPFTLSSSVAPKAVIEISVVMVAPNKKGTVRGNWRMMTTSGQFFGDEIYVQIVVVNQ